MKTIVINERDNVSVVTEGGLAGHKIAIKNISAGEDIIKYGYPIGTASCDIKAGEHVHTHNIKTKLSGKLEYTYEPTPSKVKPDNKAAFYGYRRKNGKVGIRNEIWIINTVGCVNKTAERIATVCAGKYSDKCDGVYYFPHPYGCSQLGGDMEATQKVLKGLVNHPNAAGVLVLGLGCENNNIDVFKKVLGDWDSERVKFLVSQECSDEIEAGVALVGELAEYAAGFEREECDLSELTVGLKCGGSDGFSGITANPLIGRASDFLIAHGASTVLTEVPEMFGAETILMNRCVSSEVFDKTVKLINGFKDYFTSHGQPVYENPSPGNKAGGITTLEDKSLGCTQKSGDADVVDVLGIGDEVKCRGLNLLYGPGNDIVAVTNLTASGCQLILFSTGRGTPLGAPVPTVKIASNTALTEKKPGWIDFNAGRILDGEEISNEFFDYIISVANGEKTKNEQSGYREIAIFKDGVTL